MAERIGVLGGTFNPVHRGHVELGRHLLAAFGLARVLYVLSALPPHKRLQRLPSVDLRWRMLELALRPFAGLEPCDVEIRRVGPSWTVDTLAELQRAYPRGRLFFICGSEGFLRIQTWKVYRRVLEAACFIVVLREARHERPLRELLAEIAVPAAESAPPGAPLPAPPLVFLHRADSETLAISSTAVRKRVRRAGIAGIDGWVSPEVARIIEENRLYEN